MKRRERMAAVNCDNGVLSGGGDGSGQECITSHVVGGRLKSYRYYISRYTVMEMLSNRGYNVPDSDLTFSVALSLTEFCTVFGQNPDHKCLCICVSLRSNPKRKIMVIFCGTDEIRQATLPLMLKADAFARNYGLEKGQVVKIIYPGGVAGALKTYRCIV